MKRFVSFLIIFLVANTAFSQILDPVDWDVSVEKQKDTQYKVVIDAVIEAGWHLYSQEQFGAEDEGPIRTEINFNDSPTTYTLIGTTEEPNIDPTFDQVFEMDVVYFEDEVRFVQEINVINPEGLKIQVEVFYSVCDDKQCLAPELKTFEVDLTSGKAATVNAEVTEEDMAKTAALTIDIKGTDAYPVVDKEKKGLFTIFLLGFLGGLIALLTPCVFPMIPLTVSFFTKSAKNKKKGLRDAIMYGFFIFLIYVLLSIPFHLLDSLDPEILNNISTNVVLNVIFFAIFIAFAFSFFGYFELTLPSSWSSKMDNKANKL